MRFAAGLLGMAVAAWVPLAAQAAPGDLANRQSEAERQQAALRNRIDSLQKMIDEREAARKEAADALKASESAISSINRRLRELADSSRLAEGDLASLEKQIAHQTEVLQQRRTQLADQLKAQYTSGLSPWTELLSGGDPQELGRNLGYLEYVSRARAQAVTEVRQDIDRLTALQKACRRPARGPPAPDHRDRQREAGPRGAAERARDPVGEIRGADRSAARRGDPPGP